MFLSLALVLSLVPGTAFAADEVDHGNCGGLTWVLDSDGMLSVGNSTYYSAYSAARSVKVK